MASSRFYRPKIASLTRSEKDFLEAADNGGLSYFIPDEDDPVMTRHVVEKTDRHQITYNFSMATRDNVFVTTGGQTRTYGVRGLSFRLLYEFLCQHYNGGEYFIDTYFAEVFPTRQVYDEFQGLNDRVLEAVEEEKERRLAEIPLKKDGTPNMRYRISKEFMNLAFWKKPIVRAECSRVADEIKNDIVRCLATSQIPLRKQSVSDRTKAVRETMPELDAKVFFYASGKLIRSLSVFVELKG